MYELFLKRIIALGKLEIKSKVEQGLLSRELLMFVMLGRTENIGGEDTFFDATYDIRVINKLLTVLSPANRKVSVVFYSHFLPWAFDKETEQFQGKSKKKQREPKTALIEDFLSNQEADIWSWVEENVKIEPKKPDFLKNFEKALEGGIAAGISPSLFLHVLAKCIPDEINITDQDAELVEEIEKLEEAA